MSRPPLSPASLLKRAFGASDEDDEDFDLTPGQRTRSEPSRSPRGFPAHLPPPPPPPTGIIPPPSKKPKLDHANIKARFEAYERSTKQRKDFKGKVKSSSNLAPKGGNSKPAHHPATYPPSYNQYNHGHSSTAQHPYYTDMAPPPNPRHWGVGGPYSGTQGHPGYTYPYSGYSHDMPQHSAYPPWSHSQWMPHQGYGTAPHMDRNWHYSHPQQG